MNNWTNEQKRTFLIIGLLVTIAVVSVFTLSVITTGSVQLQTLPTTPPCNQDPCNGYNYFAYYNSTSGSIDWSLGCQPKDGSICPELPMAGESLVNITGTNSAIIMHNMCRFHVDLSTKQVVLNSGYNMTSLPECRATSSITYSYTSSGTNSSG